MKKIQYNKVRKVQPNTFEYTGSHKSEPVDMQLFVYNEEGYEEYKKVSLDRIVKECYDELQADDVKWLNIHGLHDVELIKQLGDLLELETFIITDILNTNRRTKVEELGDVLFFSIKSVLPLEEDDCVQTEQVSFLLKNNLIISFQEKKSDYFTHIRSRLRTGTGMSRRKKNDYLLYLMLDAIMENFFITIESYEEAIEKMYVAVKSESDKNFIPGIEKNRDNLHYIKRAINPLREALYNLKSIEEDEEFDAIKAPNHAYFSRLHQKSLELLDQIEYDLATLDSASNFYFAAQGQRMNQIMKTLTIFSVIFMPLTFIAGVYGMNFENMPELRTDNGYFVTLIAMAIIGIIMTIYFKKKHWF